VRELLEEARPLGGHPGSLQGGGHRPLWKLLSDDRLADDPPQRHRNVEGRVLPRSCEVDDPLAAPALGEQPRRRTTDVTRRDHRDRLIREQEGRKDSLRDALQRHGPILHEVSGAQKGHGTRSTTRRQGSADRRLGIVEAEDWSRPVGMLRADRREHDDVSDAGSPDRCGDVLRAAIVVDANLARTERRRKKKVRSLGATQRVLEGRVILDVGYGHLCSLVLQRLAFGGVEHDHPDGLPLRKQRARNDLARISGSTQHGEH
jgi:hypothetical protein